MALPVQITVVVDNTSLVGGVLGEFGLSLWIEAGKRRLLFDTGLGEAIEHNARRLDIPLSKAEAVVLSHGHDDHTGGLGFVMQQAPRATLFAHPAALEQKYVCRQGEHARRNGIPPAVAAAVRELEPTVIPTVTPTEVLPGVITTGEIPRRHHFEEWAGSSSFLDEAGTRPDRLLDDQALVIDSKAGPVVLLGCAHSGVVNTLDYVAGDLGFGHIHAVVGGMHLMRAQTERFTATADAFERHGVKKVVPVHCTGAPAWAYFRFRFDDRCLVGGAGAAFSFE